MNIKQKTVNVHESGFTLIEMLFVVAILAVFYGLVLTNFGQARVSQNLRNGQAELISHIQELRSYSLSGRQVQGFSPKFYILKLVVPASGAATEYVEQAIVYDAVNGVDKMYDGTSNPYLVNIPFPQTVAVSSLNLLKKGVAQPDPTCVQIMFAVPYGKTYINENCANLNTLYTDTSALSDRANSKLTITLQRNGTTEQRQVVVYGLSGRVEAQ